MRGHRSSLPLSSCRIVLNYLTGLSAPFGFHRLFSEGMDCNSQPLNVNSRMSGEGVLAARLVVFARDCFIFGHSVQTTPLPGNSQLNLKYPHLNAVSTAVPSRWPSNPGHL